MLDEKLIDKINNTLKDKMFSVRSDFIMINRNMVVDFKFEISGVKKMFWQGIEMDYVFLNVYLPFELKGNSTKDRVFTILSLNNKEYNFHDTTMFHSLSYKIEEYTKDVLSWFGIKNGVKVDKIKLVGR